MIGRRVSFSPERLTAKNYLPQILGGANMCSCLFLHSFHWEFRQITFNPLCIIFQPGLQWQHLPAILIFLPWRISIVRAPVTCVLSMPSFCNKNISFLHSYRIEVTSLSKHEQVITAFSVPPTLFQLVKLTVSINEHFQHFHVRLLSYYYGIFEWLM